MHSFTALASAALLGSALAAPNRLQERQEVTITATVVPTATPTPMTWQGPDMNWNIHRSCNGSERALLMNALDDTVTLAQHAKDHILRYGNASTHYQKFFGSAATGEPIGWFDKVLNADRSRVLFRCDDPDGNCQQPEWAGHWRGENATDETVICELSYTSRWPLQGMCAYGYTVADSDYNSFFASDLLHRLYHMPAMGEGVVEHYADGYAESVALAETAPEEAVRNSEGLILFALDTYAYDVAVPGEGCTGVAMASEEEDAPPAAMTTMSMSMSASATPTEMPSMTSSAGTECHTHADGEVHCV